MTDDRHPMITVAQLEPVAQLIVKIWIMVQYRYFSKSTFLKNSFRNTIKASKSLNPDQARHYVQTVCKGYQQTRLVMVPIHLS